MTENKLSEQIKIKPVTKSNWDDFEVLFESRGLLNNCWCMAWRMTKEELKCNNAKCRKEYIRERIFSNIPIGLLAYSNTEAIAWCSVAPRETFQRLGGDESLENVWSIACFYIEKEFRDKGLLNLLIEEAMNYAKKKGAKYMEAYPVNPDSPSYRYMGFVKTFEKLGFNYIKKAGKRRYVMTYKL
ncbi:GNAT family N-acetyltransferase [Leptospira stimsonii]|uniref:GNAT family N-acetyltransferase n=1 Tax=Leptospira stimsonii TaxID=2202203 RepID=A0A396YNE4_9LEPT|nr:GNAT family N-acetyltransferase [Leptospira stimsonii]RHX84295.1 GNAT family N-acetyltransferase [Leptospira stimsonii]